MVHNHYLDEDKKKTQERDRNSKPSVMTPARFQSATADSKTKTRSTNHSSRSLPMPKSSCVTMPAMPKANHSKSPRYLWKPKSKKENVTPNVSMPLGNAYRTANVMDNMTSRDGENLDKMKEKGDERIFVGYSNQSRAYIVFNKRTRVIMEFTHVNFDELPLMASDQTSSDLAPECQTTTLNHDSLSPAIQHQGKVTQADRTVTTSNELDLLFSLMFDELLNGSSKYDRRVNRRLMQTQKSKIDMGKAVNDDLVVTESSGIESEVQDDNSRSGNDTDADNADIRPIYDEEPMAKVQLSAECNIFAIGQ
nr:hypothetical protein [Tanacetum cinerariifolium]